MPLDREKLNPAVSIALGAALLLLPALVAGRPFIYFDTPTFYNWGHDILADLREPWPPLSQIPDRFPEHRGLWAADNMPGAWDRITPERFQLAMTYLGARSKFYAVPFYLLGSAFTLWSIAAVQALITAWILWVTATTVLPNARPLAYLGLVAALTAATSAPFYAAFLMPDVFAAFGMLAVALLLCFYDRLTRARRIGCAVLLAAVVLVHLSNGAVLAAMLVGAAVATRVLLPRARVARGAGVAAAALVCAAGLAAVSDLGMRHIFGQPVRPPPFVQARVIADGPGQVFLREVCGQRDFVACRYKDLKVEHADDIMWPDVSWGGLPLVTDPAERRRFLDEEPAVVFGTVLHHPWAQLRASLRNAFYQIQRFGIAGDMSGALLGILEVGSDRTMRVLQIVPNIQPCLVDGGRSCDHRAVLRALSDVQFVVVLGALAVLALRVVQWLRPGGSDEAADDKRRLALFALVLLGGVTLNAVICAVLAAPWDRYQARVVWLLPMAAVLLANRGPFRSGVAAARRGPAAPLASRA